MSTPNEGWRPIEPHWERGYRTHGYWIGIRRVGYVALPPRPVSDYGWGMEWDHHNFHRPRITTLRAAKRAVEKEWRSRQPLPAPPEQKETETP